ncbi:erythromycin esterase family protein [Flavobacterium azooxidireducens]|uniref:Erythromycin esterase family protein n=1 Tax=Flavobacterium azooxidireducens TaxID=1871076 RepID=A0ABY4KGC8_9FLAO|nr:erythromycin esterase family protein [Flavobacterium azooxidireducens]UPQ79425.1 erythromycin esterase family protein [Flavobacterium azooxidireducens]
MKIILIFLFFSIHFVDAQNRIGIYKLNNLDNLLTNELKTRLNEEIKNKDVIFLGESEHHMGSEFIAKTEFVKYLVLEHNFTEIAFEADFFALHQTNSKNNIFPHWSKSIQCQDLFDFLNKHKVTIWGFDNQFSSAYSFQNFTPLLINFLDSKKINYTNNFEVLINVFMTSQSKKSKDELLQEIENIILQLEGENTFWTQALKSFKSLVKQESVSRKSDAYKIRDFQMADNLNFLTTSLKNKKVIVWAANVHSSKINIPEMNYKIMGYEYLKITNRNTYHIAFSPIKMPYRKMSYIEKQHKDKFNMLYFLPNTTENYFIDSKQIIEEDINQLNILYEGMFGMRIKKTNYFKHFDALVFIAEGEKSILAH